MGARSVPVLHGFGVEGDNDSILLRESVEDVPSDPEVVAGAHANRRPHLELPLGWHHFCVSASYWDAGIQAAPTEEQITILTTYNGYLSKFWSPAVLVIFKLSKVKTVKWR